MHEPLKSRTYLGKKLFFHFLGADFLVPKSSHRPEKQPVLGLAQEAGASGNNIAAKAAKAAKATPKIEKI